jgi:hypothetical protein
MLKADAIRSELDGGPNLVVRTKVNLIIRDTHPSLG